jgi:putative flippase GtrA
MITFTKAQLASLIATGVDFLVFSALLKWAGVPPVAASARVTFYGVTGTLCGGFTYFILGRTWVFNTQKKKWMAQVSRYVPVWIGNLALNASGLYLLTRYTVIQPVWAKVITATLVAVFYNYPLQKRFVFK